MEIKFVTEEKLERFREKLLVEFKHILSENPAPAPDGQGKILIKQDGRSIEYVYGTDGSKRRKVVKAEAYTF